jgi:hypothetical protein
LGGKLTYTCVLGCGTPYRLWIFLDDQAINGAQILLAGLNCIIFWMSRLFPCVSWFSVSLWASQFSSLLFWALKLNKCILSGAVCELEADKTLRLPLLRIRLPALIKDQFDSGVRVSRVP